MATEIKIQINDKIKELKGKELEAFLEQQAKEQVEQSRIEAETAAKEAARESAMAKLKALGLTDDEISALVP